MRIVVYDTIMLKSENDRYTPIRLIAKDKRKFDRKSLRECFSSQKMWRLFCNLFAASEQEMRDRVDAIRQLNDPNLLWYHPNGIQVTPVGVSKWLSTAINAAVTVDELLEVNPELKIIGKLYGKVGDDWALQSKQRITSSASFEEWIQESKAKTEKMEKESGIRTANVICFSQQKIQKPLFCGRDVPLEFVLRSRKYGYLKAATSDNALWSEDPKQSMVFTQESYSALLKCRDAIEDDPVKRALISKRENIDEPFNAVLQSKLGFIKARHGRKLVYTDNPREAKRYPNAFEAERARKRFCADFSTEFSVATI